MEVMNNIYKSALESGLIAFLLAQPDTYSAIADSLIDSDITILKKTDDPQIRSLMANLELERNQRKSRPQKI